LHDYLCDVPILIKHIFGSLPSHLAPSFVQISLFSFSSVLAFGSTYTKIGTLQSLAWPLRKDDMQNCEAFHIFVAALLYHRERILETSTLSCNEEEEEITKPPKR
jgi:hypothetical protein